MTAACTGAAASSARSPPRYRSAASRASTRWRAPCSGCSGWSRCTSSRPAAGRRARSCSTRSGRRRWSGSGRRWGGRGRGRRGRPPAREQRRERRLDRRELVVGALTAGQLGLILPVLAGAVQLVSNAFSSEGDIEGAARLLPHTLGGWELALAVLLAAAWAVSVVASLVTFAGFAVTREGDRLRVRRGLLQRSDAVVPVRRIHAVRVVEGVLRRPFGLASLRLEVAGYAEEAGAARTLYPLLARREVAGFLAELLPELADEPHGLVPPPARAARRDVLPPAVVGAVAGAAAWALVPGLGAWGLLAAPLLALNGRLTYRAA